MDIQFKKDRLYLQLREAIYSGKYPCGMKLPRETEFAAQLGVAFLTLRSALKQLENDKLITRLRSRGTFVNALPGPEPQLQGGKLLLMFPSNDEKEGLPGDVFNHHLALGISGQCGLNQMTMAIEYFKLSQKLVARYLNHEFDAIVWDRPTEPEVLQAIEELRHAKVPQVTINRIFDGLPAVSTDYPSDVRLAINALQRIGHRHIAMIDFGAGAPVLCERRQVFLDEIAKLGNRDPRPYFIALGDVSWNDWYDHIVASLRQIPDTTAVIIQAYFMRPFSEYLQKSGIVVPEQLSVIQWGERWLYNSGNPSPYSILSEPRHAIGRAAADIVRRMLCGEDCSTVITLAKGELNMRGGCALPLYLRELAAAGI